MVDCIKKRHARHPISHGSDNGVAGIDDQNQTRRLPDMRDELSPRPSALEMPTPVGPTMADIMMMASPAPPANWMTLRQNRIMAGAGHIHDRKPVVVHPLTDSNKARENESPERT